MKAFISYNQSDSEAATEIGLFLASENIDVWYDAWEIQAGDSIVEEVEAGLSDRTHFLVLWSKNSARSSWVRRELASVISGAVSEGSPRIIPIRLDDTDLPMLIRDLRYIEYQGGTEGDRREVVRAVTGADPTDTFIRAVVKKYNEVIESDEGPFYVRACPRCGSTRLSRGSFHDVARDEVYYSLQCRECDWRDVTQ